MDIEKVKLEIDHHLDEECKVDVHKAKRAHFEFTKYQSRRIRLNFLDASPSAALVGLTCAHVLSSRDSHAYYSENKIYRKKK